MLVFVSAQYTDLHCMVTTHIPGISESDDHSFIQAISIAPLQVRYYSRIGLLCRNFTPKCHSQLLVKDFSKVPTWRLELDSNPRPSGRKASTLSMRHHVSQPYLFLGDATGSHTGCFFYNFKSRVNTVRQRHDTH